MDTLQLNQFSEYLKPRSHDSHKGDFGHVLIIGGNFGFSGAVLMAAEAALRVGAGLVSIVTRPEFAVVLNVCRPEIMCHGIGFASEMSGLLESANVVVIGPGLGKDGWAQEAFHYVMDYDKALVVDGDALNILAEKDEPLQKNNWILTPHPGEAGRLLKSTAQDVQRNRLESVKKLQSMFHGVSVLKGAGTLILSSHEEPVICEAGNPGMATGGMGDVLSGVIGGLIAQHIPLVDAAKLGVLLHALAGDLAAEEGGERGMIATDLLPYLRRLVNWSE